MKSWKVVIAHAEGEESLAEQLARPLESAGYSVFHRGTVLVGESFTRQANIALQQGGPVVLCGTVRAIGTGWARHLVAAANICYGQVRIFPVKLEKDADLSDLVPGVRLAECWDDFDLGITQLIAAISTYYPNDELKPSKKVTTRSHHVCTQYLNRRSTIQMYSMPELELFREMLRPECRNEFPLKMNPTDFLTNIGALDGRFLTKTGVLLFTGRPDLELVSAYVQCARFRGVEIDQDYFSREILGPIPLQITESLDFIKDSIKHVEEITEGEARTVTKYEYPMTCLRELIANALCHRDYQDMSRHVHVRIFSNRIEILSPGTWMGSKRIPKDSMIEISEIACESVTRNTVLARLLSWVKYVETLGSGISRGVRDCIERNANYPIVTEKDKYVIVRVFPSKNFLKDSGTRLDSKAKRHYIKRAAFQYDEQLSFVKTRRNDIERISALRNIRGKNPRATNRIIADIPELNPDLTLAFLLEESTWNGDDLKIFVRNWLYHGHTHRDILSVILSKATRERKINELAFLYYGLSENRIEFEDEEFFDASQRWPIPERLKMQVVRIPPKGKVVRFEMGSSDDIGADDERPMHRVILSPFRIANTPVTEQQYRFLLGHEIEDNANLPVTQISWWEAYLYCRWVGGNLPTEAQWECACRAGTNTKWWTGNDVSLLKKAAWYDEGVDGDPQALRAKEPNPWGLYDIHGNVWEWCNDWYGPYKKEEENNPLGEENGTKRIIRGGNAAVPADMVRSAYRRAEQPSCKSLTIGFRVSFPGEIRKD